MQEQEIDSGFASDVKRGLSCSPKFLMSRYFYDARGDVIFQNIMNSPEYYLSNAELEILRDQGGDMGRYLAGESHFELIELGSGDGSKIKYLLDALQDCSADFAFRPVDISLNSLELLKDHLKPDRPWLDIQGLNANYMDLLAEIQPGSPRKVFAFMGSNLGNFRHDKAVEFLHAIRSTMTSEDALLIGLDLKKDPAVIKAAYNDAGGHTRDFNLNLLERINRELGANFDVSKFTHQPTYDPETGAAESFVRSETEQAVWIEALQTTFQFGAGESMFMEVSQKYDQSMLDQLAAQAGFRVDKIFLDSNHWFTDQVWVPESDI